MARTHGRFLTSIWDDQDFRALTVAAQHAYFTLTTQPRLSYAGVLDYIPGRLASLAADQTAAKVVKAARLLASTQFVVIDLDTSELLVRTYIRHDGVIKKLNVGKAMANAFYRVTSTHLRDVIITELQKLYPETQDAQGWVGVQEIAPELFALAQGLGQGLTQRLDQGVNQ